MRVAQTIIDRAGGVLGDVRPSIGCSEKRSKARSTKASGAASACVNQFEFMASPYVSSAPAWG